ncbi:hypothetical protein BD413DRAFT_470932, partial [Trametes elegans]
STQDSQPMSQTRVLREHGSGTGAWNTPIALSENSSQTFGFMRKDSKGRYPRLASEAISTMLGPMPVEQFLDVFLGRQNISEDGMPSPNGAFEGIRTAVKEGDFYLPLVNALNADSASETKRGSRCPGFIFRQTSDKADEQDGKIGSVKPDIICYAERHMILADAGSDDPNSVTDMGFTAVYIEVKSQPGMDLYRDPQSGTDDREKCQFVLGKYHPEQQGTSIDRAMQDLGQNVAYAVEICSRQHRHCCFSVSLAGSLARLIRWDRAGAVVTEAFDILAEPELLCQFFWCFAHVSDTIRGYDLTVEPATQEEEDLFSQLVVAHVRSQLPPGATDDKVEEAFKLHYLNGCVTAIDLPFPVTSDGEHESGSRRILVSRPTGAPLSVAGRCTRSYWAVDASSQKVVFLKDTWRIDASRKDGDMRPTYMQEGTTLQKLQSAGVRHIPPLVFHGDVAAALEPCTQDGDNEHSGRRETTMTQDFLEEPWVCGSRAVLRRRVVKRIHYRMILGIVGFDLLDLQSTAELMYGSYGAFQAMLDAHRLARCIHRDLSPANIILHRRQTLDGPSPELRDAYLVDWDLSCDIGHTSSEDDYAPSLWWQFASVDIIRASLTKTTHNIGHDMESLLYVVFYCGLLRLPHHITGGGTLLTTLTGFFDQYHALRRNKTQQGGAGKSSNMLFRTFSEMVIWESEKMSQWINTMFDFHTPTRFTPEDRRNKWNPDDLNKYWSTFLSSNVLPRSDRVDNLLDEAKVFQGSSSRTVLGKPHQPTMAAGSKRTRTVGHSDSESYGDGARPPRKRTRIGPGKALSSVHLSIPQLGQRWDHGMSTSMGRSSVPAPSNATAPPESVLATDNLSLIFSDGHRVTGESPDAGAIANTVSSAGGHNGRC